MNDIPKDFLDVSQRIGADPLLIQGAGGNTSITLEANLMWVKASGKWLQNALTEDVFVAVDPAQVNANIAAGADDLVAGTGLPVGPEGLRPSIETTLHSLMPHAVVFHTHSVNTIVHAIQKNTEEVLGPKLEGLDWGFVPYSKPGLPLTRLVSDVLAKKSCDVLVIQNHGLVVGGNTAAEAEALMLDVEDRLKADAGSTQKSNKGLISKACEGTDFVPATDDVVHELALSDRSFAAATGGSLYPDHVVFLGSGVAGVETAEDLKAFCQIASDDPLRPKAVALKGAGVAHLKTLNDGGLEMLKAVAEVARRAPDPDRIRYLSEAEEQELVNWDAEKYRQTLR